MSSSDIQYSIQCEESHQPDRLGPRRCPRFSTQLVDNFEDQSIQNCWSLFQLGCSKNRQGNCLGRRTRNDMGELGDYQWLTYQEVEEKAIHLGSALLSLNLPQVLITDSEPYPGARQMKFLPICSSNCVEWFICELAGYAYGFTLLPLYDTFGMEALQFITEKTQLTFAFSSAKCFPILLQLAERCKSLKSLILFETIPEDLKETAEKQGITLYFFDHLVNMKKKLPLNPGKLNDIITICYTSGSTGNPKGVLLSQGNFIACVCSVVRGHLNNSFGISVSSQDVHISYLPLAHVFERTICNLIFHLGASIGVYSSDMTQLVEDIQKLQPTIFISVPRLFTRIDDKIMSRLETKSFIAQQLFGLGMNAKLKRLHTTASCRHLLWDALAFRKTRQLLGNNIRLMLVGGAPIDSATQDRAKIFFGAPLLEGYGLTETLGTSFIASPHDPVSGHVGGPISGIEFSLCDVPEMNYRVSDFPPSGEILLRGPVVFKGYFKDEKETQAVFDQDGWFHTGDIGILLPNGGLKIIDRRNNIFKLAQGEYVVSEKIEAVYNSSPFVSQVFVFGKSTKSYLVGIVVIDEEAAQKWKQKKNCDHLSLEDLCSDEVFRQVVISDLEQQASSADLKGYEKIKAFYFHHIPFSPENGMLTPTFKLKRNAIRQIFSTVLENLYEKKI